MLRRGSGGIPYEELNRTLDSKGISIGIRDEGDVTRLVVACPSDQLDEAVRLATLILHKPDFPQPQFDNLKAQAVSSLTAELASPTTVADREIQRLLYGDTPLGRNSTPKSLAALTLADVKDYYAKVYKPADGIVVVAGVVPPERGADIAQKLTAGWAGELPPAPDLDLPARPTQRTVLLVDNPEGRQAAIRLGVGAYTVKSDEKYAGALINQILSGGIESRIMRYVRAEKGLAYHAHGVFMPGRLAGAFMGQTGTEIGKAADAIEAMFHVIDQTRTAGVTAEELTDAKRRVAGRMLMQMQTIEAQAERRLEGILNGYPADYYDRYAKRVGEVTADQIREVLNKYADPKAMQIVVVAPASASKEPLSKLGEVQVEKMPSQSPELLK
jgi:zinc protease